MVVKEEDAIKKRSLIVDTEDEDGEIEFNVKADVPKDEAKKMEDNPNPGVMAYLMANHQWLFAIWLIPFSVFYDIFWWFRTRFNYWFRRRTANLRHDEKVKNVQNQIEEWKQSGCEQPMCTARPGWKSISLQIQTYKDRMYNIKIDLPDILEIDEANKFVRVEPMATIGTLNDFLIGYGWTLPVVPELDDLTIGGLVMGGGIESTSHKYGLFQYICRRYEMVLGDGSKVWCSPEENKELFAAIPFSYGTLGFLTCVEIDIIPYKPYIELTYHNVQTLDEVVNKFTEVTNDPEVDSVEGIMYTLDTGVIMSGKFVDKVPSGAHYNALMRWYKPWFYKHVEKYMDPEVQKRGNVEFIPTDDFYHRQNRAYFWLLRYVIPFANNVLFRYLLGWTMPPKFSLLKLMRQKLIPQDVNVNFVCQDFGFKLEDLKHSLAYIHEQTEIYPLWLCPTRHCVHKGMEEFSMFKGDYVHVDIGVYGYSPIKPYDRIESQRNMERYAINYGAYAAVYAETQLSYDEFYEMFGFNLRHYDKLRKSLVDCEKAFPHVYEKISSLGRR